MFLEGDQDDLSRLEVTKAMFMWLDTEVRVIRSALGDVLLQEDVCDRSRDSVFPVKSVSLREYECDRGHDSVFPMEKCSVEYDCNWGRDLVFPIKSVPLR